MGGQGSKTSASQGSLNEGTQAQHFEFGVESEFWFMLEVRHPSAHSAKQLHQWITGLLKDTTSQILGVKYLKDGEFIGTRALPPQHVFVYGKDFKTIQQAWNCLSNGDLAIRDISKLLCMDEPSKSTPREVSASAQVRERTFDDSNYTSIGVKISDHKKTPWNNLDKNHTSLKFRDASPNLGASQKSKIYSSRGDACKTTIQDEKRYECDQTKRMSYKNEGTVATEPKLWSPNTRQINNATVGKEDEPKRWSSTCRFKNATVGKDNETKLCSNTGRYYNATVVKEDEPKPWSSTDGFKNSTVGKEDETDLWSNTARFKNTTVRKEDETQLWLNIGRFKNPAVGKEDETQLCSNTGRFKNATVGKEDRLKVRSNTGQFKNAAVGKEDETQLCSNTGQFKNAAVLKEDEPKQQPQQLTCDSDFTPKSRKESPESLPQNEKEANDEVESSKKNNCHSSLTQSGVTSERQNFNRESNREHLDVEKSSEAAFPLFNTADQPSTGDTFVKDCLSLNENEASSLAHVKGVKGTLFFSDLLTDSSNNELIKSKEYLKKRKNYVANSSDIFSDECEQNTNVLSKQDNVQRRTQSLNFTLGTSLDTVDKCPIDHVAVGIYNKPFSRHLSLKMSQVDGQNEASGGKSEIKAVQENRDSATAQENVSEEISVSSETDSVCNSVSGSSKLSDFSEDSNHNKDPFLVILHNLPVSMKRQEIIALFKGIYPGFVKVVRTQKKGKAIAVFSRKEHASNCAKQMKGKIIHGSKIVAFATISKSNSNFDKDLLEKELPGANEKVSNWLESKHLESEEFCTEDVLDQQQEQKHRHQQQQMQKQQKPQPQKHKQQQQNQQTQKQQQETQPQKKQQQKKTLKQQHHEPQQQQKQQSQKQSHQKPQQQKQKQQQTQQPQIQQPHEIQQQETLPLTRKQRKQLQHEERQLLKKHEIQQQKQQEQKPQHQQQKTLQQLQQQEHQEQQSQEQLQMQQKQRHRPEQLSSQQQQRENDIGKGKLVLLLQEQLALKQQQQQLSKVPENHAVQLRGFPQVIETPEIQKFIHDRCEGLEIINVVKDVEDLEKYFVKLKSQNDCQKVKEALQGSSFKGKKIKSTWTNRNNTNLEKPYVVIENLPPQIKCQDVKNFFANCKGVVNDVDVVENAKKSHARVYFETVDFAGEAVNSVKQMRGFRVGLKELRITPGVGISEELEWRKLECQVQEYLELLQKNREFLIRKNDEKLNDLQNDTPDPQPQRKGISLEEFVRREETKETYERKKQELIEQRSEFEKRFQRLFENFNQQVEEQRSVNNRKGIEYILKNHKSKTDREFRKFEASLPIYAKRTEILETIQHSQVVVLIGETGSGKSTQVAQYLAEETLSHGGKIVVTQPRKIAAISLAKRVSEEFGCQVGQEVGYHVGLDKKINNKTIIKFVTDRILLNEVLKGDEIMQQYSCIVIDEAHERSIHTDLLVAMLKQKLASFPHLKLIVTSATLNTEIFRTYFDNCPLVKVPGRTFPVERVYSREKPADYVEGVYDKVVEVCQSGEKGDILVFLTQQNEIEKTCDWLAKKLGKEAVILPLHGKLQSDEQQKVFEAMPNGKRKIVIATNSAETSLTIDGIRVVIDSGMVKEPSFDPERNMTTLDVKLVSKSSAEQRAGRAGRTGPGKCYCMYTKYDYSKMEPSTKPEILKMHLGMAVLQLLSLGVTDIEQFDFVESPSRDALNKALETLKLLDALNDDGTLNGLGEEMLKLPTEPQLSKALLEGLDRGCGDDVIIAAALMSSGHDVFYRGTVEKRNECAIQKQEFCQISGDLLSAIDVYKKWSEKSPKRQVAWCKENALNSKLLRSAREAFNEIRNALYSIRPTMRNLEVTAENVQESLSKSLLAGYFENIAWSFGHEKLGYMAVSSSQKARIHPSSVLCSLGDQPEWVLYQQIKRTNDQVFLINITPICYEWLAEVAMHMLQYIDEETIARLRVVRHSIYPVGPELVKAVIGYQGSTIKLIETSVSHYSVGSPDIFCAVECNVDNGMVDVYTTADSLDFATQQVEDVIKRKRRELQSFSEVFVSNVGGLKTLVASDLTTRLILQPGTSCKFNVFVEKEDVSEEVESDDVLAVVNDAGNVIHHAIFTNPKDERNFRWGTVTYSDVDQAEEANSFLRFDLDQVDLPYNVRKIQLRPIPTESAASQIYTQPSGVTVLVSWFPLPASGKAYIKCNSPDIAVEIVNNLNQQMAPSAVNGYKRAFLQKSGGDIGLHVQETDDEFTVKKQLEDCCTELQNESILKIVVPSKPSPDEIDCDAEKAKLVEVMKDFGGVNVLRPWIKKKKVCARVVFEDLDSAEDAILKLHEQMDVMGARAIYLELESRREVTCDGRMYDKIRKEIDLLKNQEINIEVESRGKRKKIIITGEDAQDVQTIGAKIADLVRPEVVMIEEAVVAKLLGSGYGRGKVRQIQKKNDVIIQTSNFGRRIQIMGKSNAKRQTQMQIEKLIEDLQKTTRVEIDLRNSERPVGAIREILKHFGKDLNKLVEGEHCQASMQIKRRKLEVHGEKEDVYRVQNKVEEFLKALPNTPRNTNVDNECPVCFADVEDPYLLTLCGHAYCSDCITQYVNNIFDSVKSADMFPQKCMFDKCESPVIKEDYSKLLNTEQLQKLYLASLECFLIGNPKYKPCSSPNCSWVYEVTLDPCVFSCPECDIRLCKKCGDLPHEKFDTCEAFKASKELSKSEQQLKEWAKGADTRMCPKCAVMIEKNKGCSHVNCRVCNAHICWKCGKFFKGSDACYSHIEKCKV